LKGRIRNSPVTAVAVSALVVLLIGGGAATAAKFIDGKRIKPGSVATKQLKNKAVNTAKLRNGAVGTGQLKNGAVTKAKLAPSARVSAFSMVDQPGFLFSSGGATLILTETLPLGPAGYVIGGHLKLARDVPGDVVALCATNRVFRDGGGIQVGSSQEMGNPAASVPGEGVATIPLAGVADTTSPPAGAVDLQVRVQCETNVFNAFVAERVFTAVPADRVNP
jgi:hypothetical protein